MDLREDADQEDAEVKVEDFFEFFELRGECVNCGVESSVSELDV